MEIISCKLTPQYQANYMLEIYENFSDITDGANTQIS